MSPHGRGWLFFRSGAAPRVRKTILARHLHPHGVRGPWNDSVSKENAMLWTIFVILLLLWVLGLITSYTLGGFIHFLLVLAVAIVLIRVIGGRSPV